MTDYKLRLFDTSGVLQAEITDFANLAYTRHANHAGLLVFRLPGDHTILTSLADGWETEVWRKPDGQVWARDFVAIFRQPTYSNSGGNKVFTAYCPGILSKLARRVVNWHAGYTNRSAFINQPTETIMKTLVAYNAGSSATTANGRKRAGVITGLTVEADGGGGAAQEWYCHGQVLLETLQKLALKGGGDFDLVKTGAAAWEFRWYSGQLGTDRTATVKFSEALGNMANPVFSISRLDEKTAACVWGKGDGADRDYATQTGTNYSAGNDIEVYISATDIPKGATAALEGRGAAKLAEMEARSEFTFDGLQTPATLYGVHYALGDLVTAVNPYNGEAHSVKLKSVSISLEESGLETIKPEFESV